MEPLHWAFLWLGLLSVGFEPVRQALHNLGDAVGGVGGVGGLTNQYNPSAECNGYNTSNMATQPYCFKPGIAGFTRFGLITLLLCTAPLALAGVANYFYPMAITKGHRESCSGPGTDNGRTALIFSLIGGCCSIIWFVVPLAYFATSPFYQVDIWHIVLAVSLSASFPLSWHLAFALIPSAGAHVLSPLLGLSHETLKICHIRASYSGLFWGSLHAVGELVYLGSQGMLDLVIFSSDTEEIDRLTFMFGFALFLILLVLSVHAFSRRLSLVNATFKRIHGFLGRVLLLLASAHWWPLVIFLTPAIACVAASEELAKFCDHHTNIPVRQAQLALTTSTLGTVTGVVLVWTVRQNWMLAHPTDYYTLSVHMFPPAGILSGLILARASVASILRVEQYFDVKPDDTTREPLLGSA